MRWWPRDSPGNSPPWFRLTCSVRVCGKRLHVRSPRWAGGLLLGVGLLAGYFLSVVPVMLSIELLGLSSDPFIERLFVILYFPVIIACDNVESVERLYDWYIQWAEDSTGITI